MYKRYFLDDLSSWYFWQWCQIYKKYKFLSVTQNMCVNEWERGGKGGEKRREGGAFNRQLRAGENIWRWHLVGEKRTLVIFCPQPPPLSASPWTKQCYQPYFYNVEPLHAATVLMSSCVLQLNCALREQSLLTTSNFVLWQSSKPKKTSMLSKTIKTLNLKINSQA